MTTYKSFQFYIHRVLKREQPGCNITRSAAQSVDSFLRTVCTVLSRNIRELTLGRGKKTVSVEEIKVCCQALLDHTLFKRSLQQANKSVRKYNTDMEKKKPVRSAPITREKRAGLSISVSLVEKYLRGNSGIKVTSDGPVFLTAVVNQVCATICKAAGNTTKELNKTNITVSHVQKAVSRSPELSSLCSSMGLVVLGQNKMIQFSPFSRLVRSVGTEFNNDLRFTKCFMTSFIELVQADLLTLLNSCKELAEHSGRETVQEKDVDLTLRLDRGRLHRITEVIPPVDNRIPLAAIGRIASSVGIKRMAAGAKKKVKTLIAGIVRGYLRQVVTQAERITIGTLALLDGLSTMGLYLTALPDKRKVKRRGGKGGDEEKKSYDEDEVPKNQPNSQPESEHESEHDSELESEPEPDEPDSEPESDDGESMKQQVVSV